MKKIFHKNALALFMATHIVLCAPFANADEKMHQHDEEHMHDHGSDPIISKVMIDELELSDLNNSGSLKSQAWVGTDISKLWLKIDGEKYQGATENLEAQALYSRAISTYWDFQTGIRSDIKPSPSTNWGVIGVKGLAPYFFDIDAALFIGEGGTSAARISAEYDILFTQRLILTPDIEANFYGQNKRSTGTGAGLSDFNTGLRLRYELCREFAPYVGVHRSMKFGKAADFARIENQQPEETNWVLGVRAWF